MLVYGDHEDLVAPAQLLAEIAAEDGCGLDHDRLRNRFLRLAGLTQAVADADFRQSGVDRNQPSEACLLDQLVTLGAVLMRSWDTACSGGTVPPLTIPDGLPEIAPMRLAEGHAFYALYPEAYGLAARKLALLEAPLLIGLRSIGTGLAAIAAAAIGASDVVTLRPKGNPFARELSLDDQLAAALLDRPRHFVIVDEGPGLSGSSLGCVADWLEDRGVPSEYIAFLPANVGELGPEASSRHLQRWSTVARPVEHIDRLRGWVEDRIGPAHEWVDLSGGAWRQRIGLDAGVEPAVTPMWERPKVLARTGSGSWQVRFAGLGDVGEVRLALAQRLHAAGFGPQVHGLTHGWLILRWEDEALPTLPSLAELTNYLALRAAMSGPIGASLEHLVTMVRRNAPGLEQWDPSVAALQDRVRPVRIDGRLQRHEWLRLPAGKLIKADALDHHQAHDLVGCQDIAWDVAGAAIELGLSPEERRTLIGALGVDPELTAFYHVAYAAFRLGAHRLSETMVDAEERERHRVATRLYELALVDAVQHFGDGDQLHIGGIEALG